VSIWYPWEIPGLDFGVGCGATPVPSYYTTSPAGKGGW
jgi:hypothetical protein